MTEIDCGGLVLRFASPGPISSRIMANLSKLKVVQIKRRVIAQKISQQREVLAALEAQERDLEITERVLTDIDAETGEPVLETASESPSVAAPASGKPDGIPTMPEMIYEALKDAKSRGLKGLEPKDMTAFIATKWWPGVKINNVGPIAWRLFKNDKLVKRNSKYRMPDEAGASVAA